MEKNLFFSPTPLYKEFMILDYIHKNKSLTQRMISSHLNVAVSMVNKYLDDYEKSGYLKRKYKSSKQVYYHLTKEGKERMEYLNISYLESSQNIYLSARENIVVFLNEIVKKGFKTLLLYGAGEVSEIMLQVINNDKSIPIEVLGVVDDDSEKIGKTIIGIYIIPLEDIVDYPHDGILISSYTHNQKIYNKLVDNGYERNKILSFFIRKSLLYF